MNLPIYPTITTEKGHTYVDATVQLKLGLCARPSASIVRVTGRYKREVYFEKDGERVNGKSIMGIMMLAAGLGSKIRIIIQGEDLPAKEIALKVYSGVTTESDLYPNFDRFPLPQPGHLENIVQKK